jgi:hypothetical protein
LIAGHRELPAADSSRGLVRAAPVNIPADLGPSIRHVRLWEVPVVLEDQEEGLVLERAPDSAVLRVLVSVDLVPVLEAELRHRLRQGARNARHRVAAPADSSNIRRLKKVR